MDLTSVLLRSMQSAASSSFVSTPVMGLKAFFTNFISELALS
jgi:hypothetical protein